MDRVGGLSSPATRRDPDASVARRAVAVAVGAAAVLTCWAAAIGRYGGPDEPAHVLRAYAVAHGDLRGEPAAGLPPGYRTVTVPASLGTGDPACYRHDPTTTSGCAAGEREGEVAVATSAGTNPPLYYALVGLPPRLFGADDDPLAHRLAAVGLVAIGLGLVAARLRSTPTRRVLALAAVTPSAWFLWGVVNPNALEIVLVALAATGIADGRVRGRMPRPDDDGPRVRVAECWWVSIPLAIAIAMRPIAAVWAATVLVLAVLAAHRDGRRTTGRQRAALVLPPVLAVVAVAAWNAWSGLVVDDERTAGTGSTLDAITSSVGGLPRTAAELVASMGWLEYWAPWPAIVAWCIAAGTVAAVAVGERPRVSLSSWLVSAAALVVVPVAFEVAWYERIGLIWQGRYSLPVAAVAVIIACASRTTGTARPAPRPWLPVVAVVAAAAGTQLTFWNAARRYAVGTDGSWWFRGADDSSRWLGAGTWVVLHGVLVALAAVLAVRALPAVRGSNASQLTARPVVSSSAPAGSTATDRAVPTEDPLR